MGGGGETEDGTIYISYIIYIIIIIIIIIIQMDPRFTTLVIWVGPGCHESPEVQVMNSWSSDLHPLKVLDLYRCQMMPLKRGKRLAQDMLYRLPTIAD